MAPGSSSGSEAHSHPLSPLSEHEFRNARDIINGLYGAESTLFFRAISLNEPRKAELIPYLEAEHAGAALAELSERRPPREALIEYDVITAAAPLAHEYTRAVVDVETARVVSREKAKSTSKPYFTPYGYFTPSIKL
jgi:primary-amine oxidase